TVTDPAGNVTNPSASHTSTGIYDASFTLSTPGVWFWYWTASGAVVDVTVPESVLAASPPPATYASLDELKAYLGITDSSENPLLLDSLTPASRKVERTCGRRFFPDSAATAKVFRPSSTELVKVDDFWTTTGLVVKVDSGDDATFATTIDSTTYELEPFN